MEVCRGTRRSVAYCCVAQEKTHQARQRDVILQRDDRADLSLRVESSCGVGDDGDFDAEELHDAHGVLFEELSEPVRR